MAKGVPKYVFKKIRYTCKEFTNLSDVNQKIKDSVLSDFISEIADYISKNRQVIEDEAKEFLENKYENWENYANEEIIKRGCN